MQNEVPIFNDQGICMGRHVNQLNYFAIELLERLGNEEPTESQINIMESLLKRIANRWPALDGNLSFVEAIYIHLAAQGKTSTQITRLLNINAREVEGHYEQIKNKLDLNVLAQTVLKLDRSRLQGVKGRH